MSDHTSSAVDPRTAWRQALPPLTGASVTLREPTFADRAGLLEVLLTAETARFGIDGEIDDRAVIRFIETVGADRLVGRAFTYVATLSQSGRVIGVFQSRGLDPMFENVECEAALLPAVRGTGLFLECAQLVTGFVFGTLNAHRLESRVLLESGRANGALRKLGALQEGVLRRAVRRDGRYFDQVLWSLLQSDWRERLNGPDSQVH